MKKIIEFYGFQIVDIKSHDEMNSLIEFHLGDLLQRAILSNEPDPEGQGKESSHESRKLLKG